jgi:hypothetical protein
MEEVRCREVRGQKLVLSELPKAGGEAGEHSDSGGTYLDRKTRKSDRLWQRAGKYAAKPPTPNISTVTGPT